MTSHDFPIDLIATPTRVLRPRRASGKTRRRLPRLDWRILADEKIASIPLLEAMRPARG